MRAPTPPDGPVIFRVHDASPLLASTRYRALMPAIGLRDRGFCCLVTSGPLDARTLRGARCIVFSKAFRPSDLAIAFEARKLGVPILLDLCDHIFLPEYGDGRGELYATVFRDMARWAAAIVTTGPALADVLRAEAPGTPVKIIPDQVETPELLARVLARNTEAAAARSSWRARLAFAAKNPGEALKRIRARLDRVVRTPSSPSASPTTAPSSTQAAEAATLRTVIWFGNHGAGHSSFGMGALDPVLPHLANAAKTHPLKLLVVSNSRAKFEARLARLPFPTEYREWSATRIFADLGEAAVCLVPNSKDAFSLCKSANRIALALSCGAAVIADDFPALANFRPAVVTDDWAKGLALYLGDEDRRRADVATGRQIVARDCSADVVAGLWSDLIRRLPTSAPSEGPTGSPRT